MRESIPFLFSSYFSEVCIFLMMETLKNEAESEAFNVVILHFFLDFPSREQLTAIREQRGDYCWVVWIVQEPSLDHKMDKNKLKVKNTITILRVVF